MPDGVLVIDKPAGPTSHDVVARVRRLLGEKRIGHTGTLDPLATGVLPLVVGRATRLARFLSASDKEYVAVVRLGVSTDTRDADGVAIGPAFTGTLPGRTEIDRALDPFRGPFVQAPPRFSAKKIGGKRSHRLARGSPPAGPAPPALPAPVAVTTSVIEVLDVAGDAVTLRVVCSAGFYVRSLAHDVGDRLGTGAHLIALRRTRSGEFGLDRALALADAEQDPDRARAAILPMTAILTGMPAVVLTPEGTARAAHGRELGPADMLPGRAETVPAAAGGHVRLLDPAGGLVGIADPGGGPGLLHPCVVLG